MLHEPCRTVGRQSTLLHAVQHGGVSCMGITNPPLALSGHARQFRAETLCSAKRGKGKGVRGALPHGGWDRVLDFVLKAAVLLGPFAGVLASGRPQLEEYGKNAAVTVRNIANDAVQEEPTGRSRCVCTISASILAVIRLQLRAWDSKRSLLVGRK